MLSRRTFGRLLVFFLLLTFVIALHQLSLSWGEQRGDVIGVEVGLCDKVEPNPVTGERLVFCCLDELFIFEEEGLQEELDSFLDTLISTQDMSTASGTKIFNSPYTSSLHEKYGWDTFCGAQIACELCNLGPLCGNNVVQEGEECDEGPANSNSRSDTCRLDCTLPICGDGVTDYANGEECDGGGDNSDSIPNRCRLGCTLPVCGDGVLDTGEQCDDGNTTKGDGCSDICDKEPILTTICGNGIIEEGEQCDDGNKENSDGCSSMCKMEFGDDDDDSDDDVDDDDSDDDVTVCGNGIIEGSEICDDSNQTDGDGCSHLCRLESADFPLCGNGIIESPEECDDRNTLPGDHCSPICTIEARDIQGICGDGVLHQSEQCDDGNTVSGDGCSSNCITEREYFSHCGDGIVTVQEQCDDGNIQPGDGCSPSCRIESTIVTGTSFCGNGIRDPGEECDDGNIMDGDGCTATCFFDRGSPGDGITQRALGERCEMIVHETSAPYDCTEKSIYLLLNTGNGTLDPGEECDMGLENSDQPNALCRTSGRRSGCGDGILDDGEQCDDGNLIAYDGCNRFCFFDDPLTPSPTPTPPPNPTPPSHLSANVSPPVSLPLGETGPAAAAALAAGAAIGLGWTRRRRKG
jgi:cysteine-rich repeat protein